MLFGIPRLLKSAFSNFRGTATSQVMCGVERRGVCGEEIDEDEEKRQDRQR